MTPRLDLQLHTFASAPTPALGRPMVIESEREKPSASKATTKRRRAGRPRNPIAMGATLDASATINVEAPATAREARAPIGPCPFLGAHTTRATIEALGVELEARGSTYGSELWETIAALEGLDFAAGWYVARMEPRDAAATLARVVAYLAGALRLPADHMRVIVAAPGMEPAALEPMLDALVCPTIGRRGPGTWPHFTTYAAYALCADPARPPTNSRYDWQAEIDDCTRDIVRGFFDDVDGTEAEARAAIGTALAMIVSAAKSEAVAAATATASVD